MKVVIILTKAMIIILIVEFLSMWFIGFFGIHAWVMFCAGLIAGLIVLPSRKRNENR